MVSKLDRGRSEARRRSISRFGAGISFPPGRVGWVRQEPGVSMRGFCRVDWFRKGALGSGRVAVNSGGSAMIELQQPAEARSTCDGRGAVGGLFRRTFNQGVADALMIPFAVIMFDELSNRDAEMLLAEEDHPIKTFRFYRSYKSLRVCVQIRTFCRQIQRANIRGFQR